jgi:glycosyltransferase involved in cell wall biosynthesis
MNQKKKLAIFIEVDSFIGDIYHHFSKTYDIKAIKPKSLKEIEALAEWADIVWFEFCNELFVHAINQNIRRLGKRVIARWHRFEIVESNFPARIDFSFIDDLILVSHDMRRILKLRVPQLEQKTRTHVVWNGLNLDKFKPLASLDKKKIVWAAKPFMRKNQPLFLQIMHALVKRDPSYTLHVAGAQEEFVMMPYLQRTVGKLGLSRHVVFHGWQRDMPAFLADKGVILSTSIHESFGYNIAEAMAVGALPVVHDYPGAEEFWPDEIRFSSIDEAVEKIMNGQTHKWSQYVREKFPLAKQLNELDIVMGDRVVEAPRPAPAMSIAQNGGARRPAPIWLTQPAAAMQAHQPVAVPQAISVQQVIDPLPVQPLPQQPYLIQALQQPAAAPQIQNLAPAQPAQQPAPVQPQQQPYLIQARQQPAAAPQVQNFAPMQPVQQPAPVQQHAKPSDTPAGFDSNRYWENRYRTGGNSGAGSYNVLAQYKGHFLNAFAQSKALSSIAEMGSGDGNQLKYFAFENYTGFDVSKTVIERTQSMYRDKPNYKFVWLGDPSLDWELQEDAYDCALSLDVLYHLIDDQIYINYLDQLFSLSRRYVVIYASNFNGPDIRGASHVRHRKFTDDVAARFPQWKLLKLVENPHKFKESTEADFAIYTNDEFENPSSLGELDTIR